MPALDQITGLINTAMQAGNFNSRKFQVAKFYNIADVVMTTTSDGDKKQPMIISQSGECTNVVYDDRYNFQVFHVIEDMSYAQAEPNYGAPGQFMEEKAEMRLIFFGNRKKLQARAEEIVAAIMMDIPKEFTFSQIQPLQLNSCVIEAGEVNTDPYQVWSNQWQGTTSFVKPESILVSLRYTVTSVYSKNCYTLCHE